MHLCRGCYSTPSLEVLAQRPPAVAAATSCSWPKTWFAINTVLSIRASQVLVRCLPTKLHLELFGRPQGRRLHLLRSRLCGMLQGGADQERGGQSSSSCYCQPCAPCTTLISLVSLLSALPSTINYTNYCKPICSHVIGASF